MNIDYSIIPSKMLELGLGALQHANHHSAYYDPVNNKWTELSVLQAAHAAEILIKAKICESHPLLIFDKMPTVKDDEMTLDELAAEGHTIEWSNLQPRLWAACNMRIPNYDIFKSFGILRNCIQHFGIVPSNRNIFLETLNFIYGVIDPFINQSWGLFAVDYDEDDVPYQYLLSTLVYNEIKFLVSPDAAKEYDSWSNELEQASVEYRDIINKRVADALK